MKKLLTLLLFGSPGLLYAQTAPTRDTVPAHKQDSVKDLKTVEVSATKNYIKETASSITIDLTKITAARLWTIAEALKQIPGVEVDAKGVITYLGQTVSIQENGFSSMGLSQFLVHNIQTAPALSFSQLTLNLRDLKTEKPTINFTRPLPKVNSTAGSISINLSTLYEGINGSFTVRRKKHLLSLNGGYFYRTNPKSDGESGNSLDSADISIHTKSHLLRAKSQIPNFYASDNISLSKQHFLNLSIGYNATATAGANGDITEQYKGAELTRRLERNSKTNSSFNNNYNLTSRVAYYWLIPTKNKNLKKRFDVNLEYNKHLFGNTSEQNAVALVGNLNDLDNTFITSSNAGNDIFGFTCYAVESKSLGKIEVAAKYIYRDYNDDRSTLMHETNLEAQNSYSIYQYGALLASWDKKLTKRLSGRILLKQDYNVNYLRYGTTTRNSYFSPYANLLFKLNEDHSLRLETEYTQLRPSMYMLVSTSTVNSGGYFIRSGNPDLLPAKNFITTLSYAGILRKVRLNGSFKFQRITDEAVSFNAAKDTAVFSSYMNMPLSNTMGPRVSVSFPFTKKLSVNLSGTCEVGFYDKKYATVEHPMYQNASAMISYMPSREWRLSASADYYKVDTYQRTTIGRMNTALMANWSKGIWSMNMMVRNIHQPYWTNTSNTSAIGYSNYNYTRSRNYDISLSLTVRLGKLVDFSDRGKTMDKNDMAN